MYSLFYNKDLIGDVLMIVYNQGKIPNKSIKEENIVKIYSDDELIGINIFNISSIVKIHANGLIPLPANEFVDVINTLLAQHNLDKLEYKKESGFKIGKVILNPLSFLYSNLSKL